MIMNKIELTDSKRIAIATFAANADTESENGIEASVQNHINNKADTTAGEKHEVNDTNNKEDDSHKSNKSNENNFNDNQNNDENSKSSNDNSIEKINDSNCKKNYDKICEMSYAMINDSNDTDTANASIEIYTENDTVTLMISKEGIMDIGGNGDKSPDIIYGNDNDIIQDTYSHEDNDGDEVRRNGDESEGGDISTRYHNCVSDVTSCDKDKGEGKGQDKGYGQDDCDIDRYSHRDRDSKYEGASEGEGKGKGKGGGFNSDNNGGRLPSYLSMDDAVSAVSSASSSLSESSLGVTSMPAAAAAVVVGTKAATAASDTIAVSEDAAPTAAMVAFLPPPPVIHINPDRKSEPTSCPFAQLCFDPEGKDELVTILEVEVTGGKRGPWFLIRYDTTDEVSAKDDELNHPTPEDFPWLMQAISSSSTDSTLSSLSVDGALKLQTESMTLSGTWVDETETTDMYLLPQDYEYDAHYNCDRHATSDGCARAIRKMVVTSCRDTFKFFNDIRANSYSSESDRYMERNFNYHILE